MVAAVGAKQEAEVGVINYHMPRDSAAGSAPNGVAASFSFKLKTLFAFVCDRPVVHLVKPWKPNE